MRMAARWGQTTRVSRKWLLASLWWRSPRKVEGEVLLGNAAEVGVQIDLAPARRGRRGKEQRQRQQNAGRDCGLGRLLYAGCGQDWLPGVEVIRNGNNREQQPNQTRERHECRDLLSLAAK